MFELTIRAENPESLKSEIATLLATLSPQRDMVDAPTQVPTTLIPTTTVPQVSPAAPVAPPAPPAAVPVTPAPAFTREQIMTAGAALIDAGKMNDLMGLLNSFDVQAVTQLNPEQLGTFATELRKLGAQI